MPKVVSLKLRELRKRGYNNVSEWLSDPNHLYIGRKMNISIYTQYKTIEPPGTEVVINRNGKKILIRPYPMNNVAFDKHLLSYPVGSYVDHNGKIIHLCIIPQSKWHNPFKVKKHNNPNSRGHVVNEFEQHLLSNNVLMNSLNELNNYTEIGCWCKPLSCHGDIILQQYHKHKIRQKKQTQNQQNVPKKNLKNNIPKTQQVQETKMNDDNNNNYVDVWDMLSSSNTVSTTNNNNNNNYNNYNKRRNNGVWAEKTNNNSTSTSTPKQSQQTFELSLSMEMRTNISVESALVIIPPKSKWNAIQNIRKSYDPAYNRWMPHINILYPFIDEKYFNQISKYITNVIIQKNNIKSFNIHLNSFDIFDRIKSQTKQRNNYNHYNNNNNNNNVWNQNKMETLFLKPVGCYQQLQKIFNFLKKDWTKCTAKNGGKYVAHLTVGKFKLKEINKYKNSLQSSWKSISFKCDAIYLISRRDQQPFKIRYKISLC